MAARTHITSRLGASPFKIHLWRPRWTNLRGPNRWEQKVGLSTETRHPTHPKKPSDPARKPSDPTPVTVGDGSPPPEPVTGGSVGGFSLPNSEKPEPTGENP